MPIESEIKHFLIKTLNAACDGGHLHPDGLLVEQYGLDSAGIFEMILWLEDRFSIHVPPGDLELRNFATLRAVGNYVRKAQAGSTAGEGFTP